MAHDYDKDFDGMFKKPFEEAEWQGPVASVRYDIEATDYEAGDTCWKIIEHEYDEKQEEMGQNTIGMFTGYFRAQTYLKDELKATKRTG